MLSAAELTAMRAVQGAALPDAGTIQRETTGTNEIGEATKGLSQVASCSARISPPGRLDALLMEGHEVQLAEHWVVTVPTGTDIRSGDRFSSNGQTYAVIAVDDAGAWRTAIRCQVAQVE